VLIGTDKFGNKFFENKDELPRWSPTPTPSHPADNSANIVAYQSAQDGLTTPSTTTTRTHPFSPALPFSPPARRHDTNNRPVPTSSPSGTPGSRTPSIPRRTRTPSRRRARSRGRPRSTSRTGHLPAAPSRLITRSFSPFSSLSLLLSLSFGGVGCVVLCCVG